MPCTYYTPEEAAKLSREDAKRTQQNLEAERKELDKVTRLLCELMSSEDKKPSKELSEWWKKHQEKDNKRLERKNKAKEYKAKKLREGIEKMEKELEELTKSINKNLESLGNLEQGLKKKIVK